MATKLKRFLLSAIVFCAAASPMLGYADSQISEQQNRDGSVVTLSRTTCEVSAHCFEVAANGASLQVPDKRSDAKGPSAPGALLVDIDSDGFFDLDNRGTCGAGPNCEHDLYRYDPSKKEFYHFYTGGYSEIAVADGYVVAQGRSSAATWETQVYEIPNTHQLLKYDSADVRIVVTGSPDGQPSQCQLLYPKSDSPRPPEKRWLKYCSHFGQNFVLGQTNP